MGGLHLIGVLVCVVGLSRAQLSFPGTSEDPKPAVASSPEGPKPSSDSPSPNNTPNTRFFPGLIESVDFLGIFSDPCQRCSFRDQQLANQCCQTGNRGCCAFLQPVGPGPVGPFGPVRPPFSGRPQGQFPGQFPGQFQGQFPGQFPGQFQGQFPGQFTGQTPGQFPGQTHGQFPGQTHGQFPGQTHGQFPGQFHGQFPGQVGPPGIPGQIGGGKAGTCPVVPGAVGFNRFQGGNNCVQECQSDFRCPGLQKCCAVGCSTVCRNPPGAATAVIQPTVKPGFCPRPKGILGGLFGTRTAAQGNTRSAALASTAAPKSTADDPEANDKKQARKDQRKEERRQDRREERQRPERKRRSPQFDRSERINDRRERRRNRFSRVFGRRQRDTSRSRRDTSETEEGLGKSRTARQAPGQQQAPGGQQDTRFFLPNIFCREECFNDFDCAGNLKCCSENDCRQCLNPSFF